MRTIAIVNQKGGCGKTTTAINLAAVCARRGLRTLVVDMDPQSHCAAGLGVPDDALENSIARALLADPARGLNRSGLVWEVARNLDLAPSTMSLAGLEAPGGGLHELEDRDRRLALVLRHLAPHYDRCFIDCPPTIGLLTYNALLAAGEAIIPVQTEYFAFRGAKKQWETIRHLVESVGHPIVCHILPTMHKPLQKVEREILDSIRKQFRGRVIGIVISDCEEVREAAAFGQPVSEYAPQSKAAKEYEQLADWIEDHPADPPTIEVEVSTPRHLGERPMTLAVSGQGAGTRDQAKEESLVPSAWSPKPSPQSLVPDPCTSAPAKHTTDSPAIGPGDDSENRPTSRAAEMARRVRDIAAQRDRNAAGDKNRSGPENRGIAHASHRDTPPARRVHPLVIVPDAAPSTREIGPLPQHAGDATDLALHHRSLVEQKEVPHSVHRVAASFVQLFGVRQMTQGVLFVQPGVPGMEISIAGDFNNWSAAATPLRFNRETGVFELLLPLAPGEYEYRLVIDGQWQADPYNTNRRRNEFGTENNILIVE